MATDQDRQLAAVLRASQRVRDAESQVDARRLEYRRAIEDANKAGVTFAAMGRALGVTRQRVKRIMEGR